MKKIFEKVLAAVMIAGLALSFASCSDDNDEPKPGKGGSMSGWVEINGKKSKITHFYGRQETFSYNGMQMTGLMVTGMSKDAYKMKPGDTFDSVNFSAVFDEDGNLANGGEGFDIEIDLNVNIDGDADESMLYVTWEPTMEGVTGSKKGEKFTIDGKNVKVKYGHGSVGATNPETTVNFHFEGTPTWLEFD